MADFNPAYAVQGGKPLPVAFGYVNGSGVAPITYTDESNNTYSLNILFDGECDGYEQMAITPLDQMWTIGGFMPATVEGVTKTNQIHFYNGRWTPIGLPIAETGYGGLQGFDEFFQVVPSVTPAQSFSNMCYCVVQNPNIQTGLRRGSGPPDPVQVYGVFRGARCRTFDSNGNVTGYGFTTNPTWHMVELLLRFKIKRQQPQIAGLTAAEIACFNWPSIFAHAQRNDAALPGGAGQSFTFNGVFAAQATLASMLETILRSCRSYIDTQDGKIGFYGHDASSSSFTLTANHCFPGTFQVAKKNLTKMPNVFVPKFRDLGIAALLEVQSVNVNNAGATAGTETILASIWAAYFNTGGINPFATHQVFFYGDGSNRALSGDYPIAVNPDPKIANPQIWATVFGAQARNASSTGGYIGTQNSRFQQRAPVNVQHRTHQLASGSVAPGIGAVPNVVPVEYDMANMTYDQANRIMQYECNISLGNDEPGWLAPLTGSVKVRLDAVDPLTLNAFIRMRPGEQLGHFTVDDTLSPEFAGDYFIDPQNGGIKIIPPSAQEPSGALEVNFRSYNPNAYPDTSYPVDDSLRTIASAKLPLLGSTQNMAQVIGVGWALEAYLEGTTNSDGTLQIAIPQLTMQMLGVAGYTVYDAVWTEVPSGTVVTLYVVDPSGNGAGPATFQFIAAGSSTVPGPAWYPVLTYNFTTAEFPTPTGAGGGSGGSHN